MLGSYMYQAWDSDLARERSTGHYRHVARRDPGASHDRHRYHGNALSAQLKLFR